MTRVAPIDLGHITADATRTWQAMAKPCPCPRTQCRTIGQHILAATRDASRGIKAANLDPGRPAPTSGALLQPPDPLAAAHHQLAELLTHLGRLNNELATWVDLWRPDRTATADDVASAADWCAHHLRTIGQCEPRATGDLCRWCYDFQRAYNVLPPAGLLEARQQGTRITARMVDEALALHMKALRSARKRRRRKGK